MKRLMTLARLLGNHEIGDDAIARARGVLLEEMKRGYGQLEASGALGKMVGEELILDVSSVSWAMDGELAEERSEALEVSAHNLEDLFALSANLRETRNAERIRVGRRQRNRGC